MTQIPTWWLIGTLVCLITMTLISLLYLFALLLAVGKARNVLTAFKTQLDAMLSRVHSIVDRLDHAKEAIESTRERVTDGVSAASGQIQRLAQHPTTHKVLVGTAAFAAFRFIRGRMHQHNGARIQHTES